MCFVRTQHMYVVCMQEQWPKSENHFQNGKTKEQLISIHSLATFIQHSFHFISVFCFVFFSFNLSLSFSLQMSEQNYPQSTQHPYNHSF